MVLRCRGVAPALERNADASFLTLNIVLDAKRVQLARYLGIKVEV